MRFVTSHLGAAVNHHPKILAPYITYYKQTERHMQTLAEACLSYAQCDDYHITADLLTRAAKRLIEIEAENDLLRAQLFEAKTKFEAAK